MVLIEPLLGARLVFVLGIANIILLLLVFFSCRCVGGRFLRPGGKWYASFYKAHCVYWVLFFASVILHAVIAVLVFGNPF